MGQTRAGQDTVPLGGSSHTDRVFQVQQAFTRLDGDVHGPGALSRAAGLDDSAVHRILQSGVRQGMFQRVGHGRYRLGAAAARLGMRALSHEEDPATIHEVTTALRREAGGGMAFVYALVPFGRPQRLCVDVAAADAELAAAGLAPREMQSVARPLRAGASGRSVLAYLPQSAQHRALDEPLPAYTGPGAFTDWPSLRASLAEVRRRGYAFGERECLPGWNTCAVPLLWGDVVMGSVALLMRDTEMPRASDPVVGATRRAADRLARIFSGRGLLTAAT